MEEEWRWIRGYEGKYEVSNLGRVRSHNFLQPKPLTLYANRAGYLIADIRPRRPAQTRLVNRLVAIHFLTNPKGLPIVNHKDSNRKNNRISNLEWVTNQENVIHAYRAGRMTPPTPWKVEQSVTAKLTRYDVLMIRKEYKRGINRLIDFAVIYGVSDHAISAVVRRASWKHVQ